MRGRLASIVKATAARGGRVIIPAFAVGRTQEILYDLHSLARKNLIPSIPIYIDSPLATETTTVFGMHPEVFDRRESLVMAVQDLFRFDMVHYTRDVTESKALNQQRGPMIIISPSGMAEVGRILHHLKHGAPDPRNTIIIPGFQADGTLGRRIVDRAPILRIFGDEVPLRAKVEILNGYSAHGDRTELAKWLDAVRDKSSGVPPVYLVHGEPPAQAALTERLVAKGYNVTSPAPGDKAQL
jgi:metallo-beta-lactamase family protein